MDAIEIAIDVITKKYKALPADKKTRYAPGVQLALGWLANSSAGENCRTCEYCRNAYVPKHAKGKPEIYYCVEREMPMKQDDYCSWFKEEE